MRSHRHTHPCPAPPSAFAGYRFPPEVITSAVRWYLRFGLSYRDVEELLAERGIEVDHVSICLWVIKASSPGPAPAAHALARTVPVTLSSWRTWPKVNERRNVPS